MEFLKGLCKRKMIIIAVAAMAISMFTTGSALCAESDYYGTYAGTYSGDDSGYWVAVISAADSVYLSYSTVTGYGDGGYIYYRAESGSTGEYYGWSAVQNTSIDPMYIDSTTGAGSGEWENYTYGESGTFEGSKVTDSAYAGSYSGSIGGDVSGSWEMTIGSNGYITGTVTFEGATVSVEGGVHPAGYFAAVGTDPNNNDFSAYGQISGSSVSGGWISEDGSEGTISGGGTGGGGDGGGDGGCFISVIKGN